ncbi:hypothetical protein PLESTB_001495700 [Pleodorina starrii]|uniref:Sulfate transporter n=1 Tax=Pleodorina starrii TaxID=330485 RepID=A0A9W6BVZ9_9CHLO|nr:hypothetical protein PLESTB_001495700 [Pleodorina starrii]
MSRPRQSSALSDLIRQATASSDVPDAAPSAHVGRPPERQSQPTATFVRATAEELAEAFFPGSSIREHAFFPKSMTNHSQHSHSHSHYGLLGGLRPGQFTVADATQPLGASPPYNFSYARGSTSAATSHSQLLHRQPSIAEGAGAGAEGDGAHNGGAGGGAGGGVGDVAARSDPHGHSRSTSTHASVPLGGESWSAWHRWMSPGMSGASPEGAGRGGGGGVGVGTAAADPHPQHQQQHHPHAHPPPLPASLPHSSFMLHSQLGRGRSWTRDAGGGGGGGRGGGGGGHHHHNHHHHHQQHQQQQHGRNHDHQHKKAEGDGAGWQAEGELTEPLLMRRHSSDKLDVEAAAAAGMAAAAAAAEGAGASGADAASGGGGGAAAARAAAAAAVPGAASAGSAGALPEHIRRRSSLFNAIVFGVINAVVSMPTLIAYAAIVFKSPMYLPYLDSLCRFFFFSSGIHQLVFVGLSSLPFAIGQVQDVGLIFLSAMASDIALRVTGPDAAAVALGSSLLAMTLSTFIVGLLTVVVARLKLADLVSYVPLPVVGGYLGFVGYFCIAGGTALAAGVQVDTLLSWANLAAWDPLSKLLPAAASIAVLMLCVEHVSHPLALPGLLTLIPCLFHAVLWGIGWDLKRAEQAGWVMPPTAGMSNCWQLWGLYNLQHGGLARGVDLGAVLAQLPKLAGLFLVVCFGSCMDVAAIQSDMPTPLDFNRELMTVGVSNMVTGAVGAGYTGSYIFSQTVFTMRQGVFNRVNGLAVAVVELVVFALPFSVVQYMPNFFFGALLVWFGIEISRDWLILSYRKLSRAEYVLLWLTFIAIMDLGLELGISAGIVMATLYFAYRYAQSQVSSLRQVAARSGRTHMYDTSSTLDLLGRRMAVLRLSGYVFFGSSTGLSNQVLQLAARMLQERAEEHRQHEDWALSAELRDAKEGGEQGASRTDLLAASAQPQPVSASAPAAVHAAAAAAPPPQGVADGGAGAAPGDAGPEAPAAAAAAAALPPPQAVGRDSGDGAMSPAERHWRAAAAISHAPIVLILDFGSVSGLDSTAARTFATLVSTLASQHVNVIFTDVRRADSRQLLEANGLSLRPYVLPPPGPAAAAAVRAASGGLGSPTVSASGGGGAAAAEGASAANGGGADAGSATKQQQGQQQQQQQQVVASTQMVAESPLVRPSAGGCWEFSSAAAAVRCCEDAYLGLAMAVGLLPAAPNQAASLQQLLTRNLREVFPSVPSDLGGLVAQLEGSLTRRQLQLGDVLYGAGAAVREVYVIEFGALLEEEHYEGGVLVGSREHGAGVVVGALEFFLGRPAPATVRCSSAAACQLLVLSRSAFARLLAHHPRALAALQVLLMRSACMDLASAQEAANHSATM